MDAKLVLKRKGHRPTVVRLKKLPMTVGRGREADLTIAHPTVSRLHCELYEVDGNLCIRDMGSMNGTFVGDSQITEASLESGDELIVGSAKFQVVIDEEVDAGKEVEAPAVAADDETDDKEGSFIAPTDFDDLQEGDDDLEEGEFEEIEEEEEEEEEFDEALIETDEGVEEPAAASDFQFEDQEDDDVVVAEDDDVVVTEDVDDVVTEDVDDVDVTEDTEDVDEVFVPESAEDDAEPSEDAEAPVEEDQSEAEEEETESFLPPQDDEIGEPAEEPAAASGKIDLGIDADDAPSKVDSDDDDLTDFLAGLN